MGQTSANIHKREPQIRNQRAEQTLEPRGQIQMVPRRCCWDMRNGGKDRNESRLAKGAGSRTIAMNTGGSEANIYLRERGYMGNSKVFTEPSEGTRSGVLCLYAKWMVTYWGSRGSIPSPRWGETRVLVQLGFSAGKMWMSTTWPHLNSFTSQKPHFKYHHIGG